MSMRQIVIDIPETVLLAQKKDEADFARELRILAAVKLFELGQLSSGRAAELAGMPRAEFLTELDRYKVFPFEAELKDLEWFNLSLATAMQGMEDEDTILYTSSDLKVEF